MLAHDKLGPMNKRGDSYVLSTSNDEKGSVLYEANELVLFRFINQMDNGVAEYVL